LKPDFFGQYLVDRGIVTPEELQKAIQLQRSFNLSVGEYAMKQGLLQLTDVNRILTYQKSSGKRFGELAVDLGLLTESQVEELLEHQRREHLFIGQALVSIDVLSKESLENELEQFTAGKRLEERQRQQLPADLPNRTIWMALFDLVERYVIRVTRIYTRKERWVLGPQEDLLELGACISFTGALSFVLRLGTTRTFALNAARNFLEDPALSETNPLVQDNLAELTNVLCGALATRMSAMGLETEMSVPSFGLHFPPVQGAAIRLHLHFSTPYGRLSLTVLS